MNAEAEVRRRIAARGPMTFAEFMEVALYWPSAGYYTSRDPIGSHGDYFTSPLAHPAFGALLAVQLFQMWQLMGRPASFTVVELGAGNGLLCRDIMGYAEGLPDGFGDCLRYVCIDRREAAGHERGTDPAHRLAASGLPLRGIEGCVLSNELLDAFPVHQIVMRNGCLREVFVELDANELVTRTGKPSTPALAERLDNLGVTFAEGQSAEINLGLAGWAEETARALRQGFVLTIDYGRDAADLYSAEQRPRGTLTTYYQHLQTDAPLNRVGRQDISAQVDFTSVIRSGQQAGLEFLGAAAQGEFLQRLGIRGMLDRLGEAAMPRTEFVANRTGMLELVKPGGLGDFQVVCQGKNVGRPALWGLQESPEPIGLVGGLVAPTLTPHHLGMASGHLAEFEVNFDDLWPGDDEAASAAPLGH